MGSDLHPNREVIDPGSHTMARTLREVVMYPPHGPRQTDPQHGVFEAARHHLIDVLGVGCWIGGATLQEVRAGVPAGHRCVGASQLEAHHAIAEFAGLNEIDWEKVAADFPKLGIDSDAAFLRAANSEGGLMILCDLHHRAAERGIHSITYPAWLLDRYAETGWEFDPGRLSTQPEAGTRAPIPTGVPA